MNRLGDVRAGGSMSKSKAGFLLAMVLALASCVQAQTANAKDRLVGAWHLVRIDAPGADLPQPTGMLVYTHDGHFSVQLMYPPSADTLSNEYMRNGYEASFGSYDIDEAAHTVTHNVLGSITGDLLVGKNLRRRFEFTPDGHLVIRSTRPDEHWFVTWEHY
jgi:hypothetical protein